MPECVNCNTEDFPVRVLPDGALHPDDLASIRKSNRARVEAQREEGRQKALHHFSTWHGTKAHVPEDVPGESRPLHGAVAQIFEGDLPAPEKRLRHFACFIEDDPEYKCVGWSADIVSVTPNEGGWAATVYVRPELANPDRMLLYTPYNTVEKWQIAPDGTATALDVQAGEGYPFVFAD